MDARRERELLTFHLISGAGASSGSWFHWAREKARAEQELIALAEANANLKVISYRPGGVYSLGETGFKSGLYRNVFVPLKMGISSYAIGNAMAEVTARGDEIPSGTILENRALLKYNNAFEALK